MSAPYPIARALETANVPPELEVLAPPPLLLPGECLERYEALRQAIFADIAPRSTIEWLLAIDVAELSWEINRYRVLRHKVLEAFRHKAIQSALRQIDVAGIAPEFQDAAEHHNAQNALSWRNDPIAATEIETRLSSYGFDHPAINMEVHLQARDILASFESLLNVAQAKRLLILREIRKMRTGAARKHALGQTGRRKSHSQRRGI
ncbi:hypothetical protein [uncultured Bradyrhizobium sp.]|jgi:hypothetical protein|uniref:hypothetical protein n=1 Tax=uncultured Bradyrhizobium sp. TaxID=199684 RepID=UPI0026283419|nr:hypothetical protein [uncultured Bradyrhizobium sp.]